MPAPARRYSGLPHSSCSRRSCRLTAGWLSVRMRAAAVTLPSRATMQNAFRYSAFTAPRSAVLLEPEADEPVDLVQVPGLVLNEVERDPLGAHREVLVGWGAQFLPFVHAHRSDHFEVAAPGLGQQLKMPFERDAGHLRQSLVLVARRRRKQPGHLLGRVAQEDGGVQPAELHSGDVIQEGADGVVAAGRATPVQELLTEARGPLDPAERVEQVGPYFLHRAQEDADLGYRRIELFELTDTAGVCHDNSLTVQAAAILQNRAARTVRLRREPAPRPVAARPKAPDHRPDARARHRPGSVRLRRAERAKASRPAEARPRPPRRAPRT